MWIINARWTDVPLHYIKIQLLPHREQSIIIKMPMFRTFDLRKQDKHVSSTRGEAIIPGEIASYLRRTDTSATPLRKPMQCFLILQ